MTPTQDILAANQAFYRSFEKMDIEAMAKVWSKGTSCICIHPGREALRGWDKIRDSWDLIFQNTSRIEIKTTVITTEVNDDLAYTILIENLVQVVADRPVEVQTIATNIFERMGSGWYLVHRHSSPVMRQGPPPPEAMQPPPPPGFLQGPN